MTAWSALTRQLVEAAYDEDVGAGDLTSALLPRMDAPVTARVVPRQAGVIAGLALGPLIAETFGRRLGAPLRFVPAAGLSDGAGVAAGQAVARLEGPGAAVLATERTLLNFLGRLSGVATLTARYVGAARAVAPRVRVLDTRKTTPGWRELEKYAVRCGGGENHRFGLHDAVLIKDNHLAGVPPQRLAAHLRALLAGLATASTRPAFVEVEVDSLRQLAEVLAVPGVDMVLLDNFAPDELRSAVALRDQAGLRPGAGPRAVLLEASGGVTLETIAAVAATGVERISVGALTHGAVSLDVGLDR